MTKRLLPTRFFGREYALISDKLATTTLIGVDFVNLCLNVTGAFCQCLFRQCNANPRRITCTSLLFDQNGSLEIIGNMRFDFL